MVRLLEQRIRTGAGKLERSAQLLGRAWIEQRAAGQRAVRIEQRACLLDQLAQHIKGASLHQAGHERS